MIRLGFDSHCEAMVDLGYEDGFASASVAVLLSVTCATVASCDDIVAFGKHHLHDLRRYAPFHHGVPCARWIRALVNRIDPVLFAACFESLIKAMWPDRHDLIAINGKTSRRNA